MKNLNLTKLFKKAGYNETEFARLLEKRGLRRVDAEIIARHWTNITSCPEDLAQQIWIAPGDIMFTIPSRRRPSVVNEQKEPGKCANCGAPLGKHKSKYCSLKCRKKVTNDRCKDYIHNYVQQRLKNDPEWAARRYAKARERRQRRRAENPKRCVDCNVLIGFPYHRKRCPACAKKEQYRKTLERKIRIKANRPDNHCLDCGVVITYRRKRCLKCAAQKINDDNRRRYRGRHNVHP